MASASSNVTLFEDLPIPDVQSKRIFLLKMSFRLLSTVNKKQICTTYSEFMQSEGLVVRIKNEPDNPREVQCIEVFDSAPPQLTRHWKFLLGIIFDLLDEDNKRTVVSIYLRTQEACPDNRRTKRSKSSGPEKMKIFHLNSDDQATSSAERPAVDVPVVLKRETEDVESASILGYPTSEQGSLRSDIEEDSKPSPMTQTKELNGDDVASSVVPPTVSIQPTLVSILRENETAVFESPAGTSSLQHEEQRVTCSASSHQSDDAQPSKKKAKKGEGVPRKPEDQFLIDKLLQEHDKVRDSGDVPIQAIGVESSNSSLAALQNITTVEDLVNSTKRFIRDENRNTTVHAVYQEALAGCQTREATVDQQVVHRHDTIEGVFDKCGSDIVLKFLSYGPSITTTRYDEVEIEIRFANFETSDEKRVQISLFNDVEYAELEAMKFYRVRGGHAKEPYDDKYCDVEIEGQRGVAMDIDEVDVA